MKVTEQGNMFHSQKHVFMRCIRTSPLELCTTEYRVHLITSTCGVTTKNSRLADGIDSSFIDMLGKYTTCIMRSLRRSSRCYWSAVDGDNRATVVEVG
jgi:hypothetical protein